MFRTECEGNSPRSLYGESLRYIAPSTSNRVLLAPQHRTVGVFFHTSTERKKTPPSQGGANVLALRCSSYCSMGGNGIPRFLNTGSNAFRTSLAVSVPRSSVPVRALYSRSRLLSFFSIASYSRFTSSCFDSSVFTVRKPPQHRQRDNDQYGNNGSLLQVVHKEERSE